jgi:Flp pilus assembly protein TadG
LNVNPAPANAPAAPRRRVADQRGASTVASLVILFPVLIVMFMALVQWGLYFHARQVLTAAAQDAVRAAQDADAGTEAGHAAAAAVLEPSTRAGLFDTVAVDVSHTGGTVRATAHGRLRSLVFLPGFDLDVAASAEGPKEQFVPENQR